MKSIFKRKCFQFYQDRNSLIYPGSKLFVQARNLCVHSCLILMYKGFKVMKSIFRRELLWFYQDGCSLIYPDKFESYRDHIPEVGLDTVHMESFV